MRLSIGPFLAALVTSLDYSLSRCPGPGPAFSVLVEPDRRRADARHAGAGTRSAPDAETAADIAERGQAALQSGSAAVAPAVAAALIEPLAFA